ncbi:MAG: hypothetical protein LN569_02650 [Rickettsia endosymbiont of Labidopullus appendiculatus]|nr:hypothetical protein [Rickettsia endosymbiont of Labidopullus appendiculatus]
MVKKLTKLLIMITLWGNTATVYAEKSTKVNRRDDMPNKFNRTVLLEDSLPNYVTADISNLEASSKTSIRIPASPIKFPLFKEDKKDIDRLIKKFNNKKKREIVFSISSREPLKKWRPDLTQTIRDTSRVNCFTQTIPNTPCINPVYIPIGIRMPEDDEYFYVRKNETSPVRRYKKTLRQKMESKIKCVYY